jgi:hypothetical protein
MGLMTEVLASYATQQTKYIGLRQKKTTGD